MAKISKEAQKRWNERVRLIRSVDFKLNDDKEEQLSRIARAKKDYSYFARTYFPHHVKKDSAKFQINAAEYLKNKRNAFCLFEWMRGAAKSTHISLMIPIWLMIQDNCDINTMVLVSKSEKAAVKLLSDLQAELEANALLIKDFGSMVSNGSWTEGEFVTSTGVYFKALGRGQSPRGIKHRGNRPDYIIIDDIDDDELCRNPRRVKQIFDWVMTALYGSMDAGRGRFILVGNRISQNSVLAEMAKTYGVHHVTVNILDKNGQPTWKENHTLEEISYMRMRMGERKFMKEYMNTPIIEGSVFEDKYFQWAKMLPFREYEALICYTDPSFKSSSKNDYKATILLGKTKKGYYHVIKVFADQTNVSEMVRWHYFIRDMVGENNRIKFYMESNFMQDLLLDEFRKEGEQRGDHIPIIGDKRKKIEKSARIEALQPLFERGLIIFNEDEKNELGMRTLVDQLVGFEKGGKMHDDAPDALEGAIDIASKRDRKSRTSYAIGGRGFSCR